MKDNLVIFWLGIAYAACVGILTFALALSDKVVVIQANMPFLERQIENCVPNDIYQIEKMMILDKISGQ